MLLIYDPKKMNPKKW